MSADRCHWWMRVLAGVCVLQFLLLATLTAWWNNAQEPMSHPKAKLYSPTNMEPYFLGRPGPWGELEYARINIEPPDEFIPTGGETIAPTEWVFEGFSAAQLADFLKAAELTAAERAQLLEPATWSITTDGIRLSPKPELVLSLGLPARQQIYAVLARSTLNPRQFQPYAFRTGGFDDWIEQSGLSNTTLAWLKRLVYPRGAAICFSDLPELLSKLPTAVERQRLIKVLWRNPTILMKLCVRSNSDVDALTAYWARGWHSKDIRSLLASLTKVPGGIAMDVGHLLPPFARRRLFSYPNPATYSPAQAPDCYWTALNFFKDPPDDRFHNQTVWQEELVRNYTVVASPAFGDVILLQDEQGKPLHAAVFIADDVVFTKNGGDFRQPWMLMRIDDLLACYHHTDDTQVKLITYRSRENVE